MNKIYISFQKKEEKKQKEISIQVPVNARNQFNSETLRNFSLCYSVRFDPTLGDYTFEEILKQVALYLRYINNKKTLGAMFASNIKLESTPVMRIIPLVIKDLAIGISYALTAECTTTALLTNLGKVDLPQDMLPFVESTILMPPPGLLNGGRIGLSSVKNVFTVAVANCYEDTDFENISIISAKLDLPGCENNVISLIGPKRMDYDQALNAMRTLIDEINEKYNGGR